MNPVAQYRQEVHLTQRELADLAGCSVGAVLRAEQGLYNKILPCLVDMIPHDNLSEAYHRFQIATRKEAKALLLPIRFKPKLSPLFQWREAADLSAVGACKALCVHPAVWANMESGKTKAISSQLLAALHQGEYSNFFIEHLTKSQEEFCNAIFGRRV